MANLVSSMSESVSMARTRFQEFTECLKQLGEKLDELLNSNSELVKMCINLQDRLNRADASLEQTDRDGTLSVVSCLADRCLKACMQPIRPLTVYEIAMMNGNSKLSKVVTSYELIAETQQLLDSSEQRSLYLIHERLLQGEQDENDLGAAQKEISDLMAEIKTLQKRAFEIDCDELGASSTSSVVLEPQQEFQSFSSEPSDGQALDSNREFDDKSTLPGNDEQAVRSNKPHIESMMVALENRLDIIIANRDQIRIKLLGSARRLLLDYGKDQAHLVSHKDRIMKALCKVVGHGENITSGTNDQDEGAPAKEDVSAISSALVDVRSWLQKMEELVGTARGLREKAALGLAMSLIVAAGMLIETHSNRANKLLNDLETNALSGSHKDLEIAFLAETEVFTKNEVLALFPFNSVSSALLVSSAILEQEFVKLRAIPREVERFATIISDLEPWTDRSPKVLIEEIQNLRENCINVEDSKDNITFAIEKAKRRGLPTVDLQKEEESYRTQLAGISLELERKISEAVLSTWNHFPEHREKLSNQMKSLLKLSVEQMISSNGILNSRSLSMYRLYDKLASGGLDARHNVWKAMFLSGHNNDQSPCVLKEYSGFQRVANVSYSRNKYLTGWASFVRETGILSKLKHPHIVQINCCFLDSSGNAYIEMPFYCGGTLLNWLDMNPSDQQVHRVLTQILRGIEHLHSNSVIHCDLKPSNILMSSQSLTAVPYIADFDISKSASERGELAIKTATGTAGPMGSLGYIAPELHRRESNAQSIITPKIDVFAFGVITFDIFFPEIAKRRNFNEHPAVPNEGDPTAISLVKSLLENNPSVRPSATQALEHEYFTESTILTREEAAKERAQFREQHNKELSDISRRIREARDLQMQNAEKESELSRKFDQLRNEEASFVEAGHILTREALSAREELDKQRRILAKEKLSLCKQQDELKSSFHKLQRAQEEIETKEQTLEEIGITHTPMHWKIASMKLMKAAAAMVDVTPMMSKAMQSLLNNTKSVYCDQITFNILKVTQLENPTNWKLYVMQRAAVMNNLPSGRLHHTMSDVATKEWLPTMLHKESNEAFLFHGTIPRTAHIIASGGFDERVFSLDGLFGAGIYLAENVDKSLQYCQADVNGISHMFVVRVTLGTPFLATKPLKRNRRPPSVETDPCQLYDSVIGVTKATQPDAYLNRHREFVVYDRRQTYPEWLVEFKCV